MARLLDRIMWTPIPTSAIPTPTMMSIPTHRPRNIGTSEKKNIMNERPKKSMAKPLGSGSTGCCTVTVAGGGTGFPQLRQKRETSGISAPHFGHCRVSLRHDDGIRAHIVCRRVI
jgi:hypothetical protein